MLVCSIHQTSVKSRDDLPWPDVAVGAVLAPTHLCAASTGNPEASCHVLRHILLLGEP
jgi:hypothetical protein